MMIRTGFGRLIGPPLLALPLLALALPAWSEDSAADAPVATAAPDPAPTAKSKARADADVPPELRDWLEDAPAADPPAGPRKPHGEVSVGVGAGGYRSVYARGDMPVGKTGEVSIAVGQTRFNGRGGWLVPPTPGLVAPAGACTDPGRFSGPLPADCNAPPITP